MTNSKNKFGLGIVYVLLLVCFASFTLASPDQPDERVVGFVYLEDDVVQLWNENYDYYFDVDSAIQLTNHFDEFWTENVFCLGWRNETNESLWSGWNRKCSDDLNMNFNLDSDNETWVNLTFYKIREIGPHKLLFAVEYYLESGDTDISVKFLIRNLKNVPINKEIGFGWHIRDIKIGDEYDNNEINIGWQDFYDLDEDLDLSYTNGDLPATEFLLKREDEWLRLKWDEDDPWLLKVKSKNNQINAPVTLATNLGTLGGNEEVVADFRWIDALCKGDWGDDSSPYPVNGDDTKFSDSDTVDLNCHLIGDQCPSSPVVGQCGGPGDQGFMSCRIQIREEGSSTWSTIASSANGDNCDFDDDSGSNFASLSNYMIDHDDKTDIRCKAVHVYWHSQNEICAEQNKGHTKSDDWWFNANTPNAINVVINDSNSSNVSNVTVLDDLDCDYTFDDSDNDSENVSAAVFVWYVNDVDIGVDNQMLDSSYTNVGDDVICSVKVFDDVFSTGNEVFVNSSNVSVFGIPDQPGSLKSVESFSEDSESSYVFNGRNRILELKGDGTKLYRHHDTVGSTSLATDESGSVKEEVIYLPFGGKKFENNFDTFYTGKELDSSGLMYFGSRYYDSASGRFTQVDPVLRSAEGNYHYANNNPLKYIDPDGNDASLAADFEFKLGPQMNRDKLSATDPIVRGLPEFVLPTIMFSYYAGTTFSVTEFLLAGPLLGGHGKKAKKAVDIAASRSTIRGSKSTVNSVVKNIEGEPTMDATDEALMRAEYADLFDVDNEGIFIDKIKKKVDDFFAKKEREQSRNFRPFSEQENILKPFVTDLEKTTGLTDLDDIGFDDRLTISLRYFKRDKIFEPDLMLDDDHWKSKGIYIPKNIRDNLEPPEGDYNVDLN